MKLKLYVIFNVYANIEWFIFLEKQIRFVISNKFITDNICMVSNCCIFKGIYSFMIEVPII